MQKVYGCNFVEGFETYSESEAAAMDMVHGSRSEIEDYLLATGRYTRDSARFEGAVNNLIDYGVWQETRRLQSNPLDHMGIDHPS